MKRLTLFALLLTGVLSVFAQNRPPHTTPPPVALAYYDLDRLYDTLPARYYDDSRYTPTGELRWTSERYRAKIAAAAATIEAMGLPLVALYGVENEQVVRDLVTACPASDYSYIHRTLNRFDGLDFALLYHGDRLLPDRIEEGRNYLCIEGLLDGRPVALILTRGEDFLNELIEELRSRTPRPTLLCAGKLPHGAARRLGLEDPLRQAERAGRGNARSRSGWWLHDRILCDKHCTPLRADIYARRELFDPRGEAPAATFRGTTYTGGAGRYLPVFLYLGSEF